MALVLKDRVKETSVTTGTGAIALDGATGAYQPFSTIGNGNTTYYCIAGQTTNEWEVGIGTYDSGTDSISRDTILASSNSGSIVTFSAGTKDVFITYPSEKAVYEDAVGYSNIPVTIGTTAVKLGETSLTLGGLTSVEVTQNPLTALQLATKQYVDDLVSSGIHFHQPVRVESPINLNATYNNGASGVGATLTNAGTQAALVIDGVTVSVADRVLVYQQTNQTQNGVYVVTSVGSGSTNWVLTRSSDTNTYGLTSPNSLGEGSTFFVQQGTTGAGETYTCNTTGVITFGTTNITFTQISATQIYSAGTGLTLSGTQFSITNTAVMAASYGAANKTLTATVNAQGQLTSLADTNIAIAMNQVTSGTLGATQGGTGQSSYQVGDLIFANTTTSLSALADVATGNVLISGGIGAAPSYGKVGLTTHVSGTLPVANGGTGVTSSTGSGSVVLSTSPTLVTPALGSPTSGNFSAGTFTWPTFNQNTTGTAANVTGIVAIANGGTGESTRQAAMDALAGATTSGQYLRGNGTDVVMANIVAGDVPTLNQNTTGNAATATVLQTARTIGGVSFNGSANIDLPGVNTAGNQNTSGNAATATTASATTAALTAGTYLTSGGTFNGSTARTFAVDATTTNTASKVVARDASGNFSAGTITAALSGNASTATTATNQSGGTVSATTGAFSSNILVGSGAAIAPGSVAGFGAGVVTEPATGYSAAGIVIGNTSGQHGSIVYGSSTMYFGTENGSASTMGVKATLTSAGNFNATGTISGTNITTGGNVTGSSTSCSGNAATATNLTSTQSSWQGNGVISAVVGQLAWKNYGNNHVIFDASQSTSPSGTSVNNANAQNAWTGTFPTLMGWNGANTYGVRVDSARVSDSCSGNAATASQTSMFSGRTDSTAYPVVWGTASATSPLYSCTAVNIQSSTGTLNATKLTATPNTSGVSTGITAVNGDLTAYRSGGTTGVVYLSSSGSHYLYWDGTQYNLNAGNARISNTTEASLTVSGSSNNFSIISTDSDYAVLNSTGTGLGVGVVYGSGICVFENSTGNVGIGTTSPTSKLQVAGQLTGQYGSLSNIGVACNLASNHVVKVSVSGNKTLTTTIPPAGTLAVVMLNKTNTSAATITFGTGFKSTGTVVTGTTSGAVFVISFVSDGSFMWESSRTTQIV